MMIRSISKICVVLTAAVSLSVFLLAGLILPVSASDAGGYLTRATALSEELLADGEPVCPACGYVVLDDSQEHLTLQVKGGIEKLDGRALELYQANQDIMSVVDSAFSLAELKDAYELVTNTLEGRELEFEAAIDPVGQQIDVVLPGQEQPYAVPHTPDSTLDLLDSFDLDVPVNIASNSDLSTPAKGRNDDYSRFFMGGKIVGPSACSLGMPVRINGKSGVLTAGHCGSGEFKQGQGKLVVGNTYISMYNASTPQDWQILTGSTYANKVFNTPAGSSSEAALDITGVHLQPLAINRQLCASGYRTGQTCRYFVQSTAASASFEGKTFHNLTRAVHLINGQYDCNGFNRGDSGGLAYFADGKGGVKGYGIVTSFGFDDVATRCTYSFTPLSQVQSTRQDLRFLSTDR